MSETFPTDTVDDYRRRLEGHPVYAAVATLDDLRCFMEHHVYSVWDFMSLIKHLQSVVAPTRCPWTPGPDAAVQRFINELVLEEESDEHPVDGGYSSHYELYLQAMREVGADPRAACGFVARVRADGIAAALDDGIPAPSRAFTAQTFAFIDDARPHVAAAALALGREHVIPAMFRAILARSGVDAAAAPVFHAYLERHVHLDEDFHAPLSLRLLDHLCAGDPARVREARAAADRAIDARLALWDGVLEAIRARRSA